jgi:hypothetical protein
MDRQTKAPNRVETNRPESTTVRPGKAKILQPPPMTWGYSPETGAAAAGNAAVADEAIAKRAYLKFLARGCQHGKDYEDWIAAREELLAEGWPQKSAAPQAKPNKKISPLPSEQLEEKAREDIVEREEGGGAGGD